MNCREFMRLATQARPIEGEALEHLKACSTCSRLEDMVTRERTGPAMPADRIEAIQRIVAADLAPVRPIASPWRLAAWFAGAAAVVLLLGAATMKTRGLAAIGPLQALAVFSIAAVAIILSTNLLARLMAPGSLLPILPGSLAVATILALASAVAALFPTMVIDGFLAKGLVCLAIGTSFATTGLLLANSILRKGAVLDRTAAGIGAGLSAGAAAFAVQEIYCPYVDLWHVLGFHVPTIGIAIAIAVLWRMRRLSGKER